MRITNKIIQNNSLSNINLAKIAEDARSQQVSSGKKIVRPSDDPIVAIRSLRLRSSVVEITQYYSRNAKDAEAWLKTTEDAMQQVAEVITDMITQYNKGANEYLTSEERNIVLEQLKALKGEVYDTGDADYAGRYVFTGYRTESSLMFREDTKKPYQITEQVTAKDLRTNTFVKTGYTDNGIDRDLTNLLEGTQGDYANVNEDEIDKVEYHRIRLSYNNCDEATADNGKMPVIQYLNKDGEEVKIDGEGKTTTTPGTPPTTTLDPTVSITCRKSTDVPSPYIDVPKDGAIYLSDTGELLLGDDLYKELSDLVDDPLTSNVNEGEIRVSYQKSEFKEGDLKPEHYFYCIAAGKDGNFGSKLGDTPESGNADDIVYNPRYLKYGHERQVIEYDVGYNQRLQVNTIAEECFNPAVNREVDDMIQALERMQKIEEVVGTLKGMLEKETNEDKQKILQKQLDAANKAFTYERKVVQDKFSGGLKEMKGFLNEVNVAVTACGARGSRLELVSNRLCSQKTTFETLKSENEDVDLSEAVVQLTSAEMTYEAALKATGKIMQVNLMDFI